MNATPAFSADQAESWERFPALRRSFRRGDVFSALRQARGEEVRRVERELSTLRVADVPWAPLERATLAFRLSRAADLRASASEARAAARRFGDAREVAEAARRLVDPGFAPRGGSVLSSRSFEAVAACEAARDLEHEAERRARWYERRAAAQLARFASVRACGSASLRVACRVCEEAGSLIPCRCGVVRVCDACADHRDQQRRARIVDARVRVMTEARARGLLVRTRPGGALREKMLTLTVPHFKLEDAGGAVRDACDRFTETTVAARVAALRLAWPRFLRALRRRLVKRDPAAARALVYFRCWEWTRGTDGLGHPHLHVYLLAPFLDVRELRAMWGRTLEAVGVPCPRSCRWCWAHPEGEGCEHGKGRPHTVIDLRVIERFDWRALRELVKNGDRRMVRERFGVLRDAAGAEIVSDYAAGWTFADAFASADGQLPPAADLDVQRDLFVATEGRRMFQGSRGFVGQVDARPCACCGAVDWSAGVVREWEAGEVEGPPVSARVPRIERGPPDVVACVAV